MAPLGTALQVTHCHSSRGVRHAHSYQGLSPIYLCRWHSTGTYLRWTKPLCEVVQDLPASGSRKARTNTHQGLVTQSCRALSLHITHKPPGPLQDHHFCSFLLSLFNKLMLSHCRYKRKVKAANFENIRKTRWKSWQATGLYRA